MQYRKLGKSDVEVSVLGFGCGGNARVMVEEDEELRLATVGRALELGINYFDTAAAYGDGRSERNLGRALKTLGADPVISTKVVIQEEDLTDARSAVLRNFDEGLERLGRERVDALMLHNRVFKAPKSGKFAVGAQLSLDNMLGKNGVVEAFQEIINSGRTKIVGFTTYGGDPECIEALVDTGVFGAINSSINFLNASALLHVSKTIDDANYGNVAQYAADHGLGVMAIQVLARGVLTGAGPAEGLAAEVAKKSLEYDTTLPSVATRYVLSKPAVSTAIMGLSEPSHVDAAVEALEKGPLPAEAVAALDQMAYPA